MRKILAVCILCAFLLVGCEFAEVEKVEEKAENLSMFVVVETASNWKVVYNKETRVMYAISFGGYNAGTFTLLVNADGTPMLWKEGEQK